MIGLEDWHTRCTKAPPQPAGCLFGWLGFTVQSHAWQIDHIWTTRPFSVLSHEVEYECAHCKAEMRSWGVSDATLLRQGIDIPDTVRSEMARIGHYSGVSWYRKRDRPADARVHSLDALVLE